MMLRTLGSPARPLFGFLLFAVACGFSARLSFQQFGFAYLRWPTLANNVQYSLTVTCLVLGPLVAYNTAAIAARNSYFANNIGKIRLSRQVLSLCLWSSSITIGTIVLAQLPLIVRALTTPSTGLVRYGLIVLSSLLFSVALTAVAAIIGWMLRSFHPVIGALAAGLMSYFAAATISNSPIAWAVSPLQTDFVYPATFFNLDNCLTQVGGVLSIALLSGAIVYALTSKPGPTSRISSPLTAGGALALILLAGIGVQSFAGELYAEDSDVCKDSASGIEVCVSFADQPGLEAAIRDVDAVQGLSLSPPKYQKIAEFATYKSHTRDLAYKPFHINPKNGRADLSELALQAAGIGNCTDRMKPGAMVIERVAAYFLTEAGAYSKPLEKYGALYQSIDETGEATQHINPLTELSKDDATALISSHWESIYGCTGTYDMLTEPKESH